MQTVDLPAKEIADRLRVAYVEHRRQHIRRASKNPNATFYLPQQWKEVDRFNKTIWDRLAQQVRARRLCPELLVSIAFKRFALSGAAAPMPTQLLSQQVLNYYRNQFLPVTEEEARENLSIETTVFRRHVQSLLECRGSRTLDQIRRAALLDRVISVSPLFRYCAAVSEGIHDLAREFETMAIVQFSPSWRAYSAAWGDFIPQEFCEANRELL